MLFNTTKKIASALFLITNLGFAQQAAAQCTIALNGGKSVTFKFTPVSVVTPSSCSWGYNYDIKLNYTTSVNGPLSFNDVQVGFTAGSSESFGFSMTDGDVNAGSGTITTSRNQYRSLNDCATATPSSLNIRNLVITTLNTSAGTVYNSSCSFASSSISTPLPVKLVSFDAAINKGKVDLAWVTATETENAYFILERSNDAQTWEAITKMDGAGTTRYNTTYNYTDDMPQSGMNYYRLKQVDANGTAAYSRTLGVKAENADNAIALYPNPNNGENIRFTGIQNAADWSIKVINTSSAVVYQSATIGEQVALPSLPAGMYFVQLQNTQTGATQLLKLIRK